MANSKQRRKERRRNSGHTESPALNVVKEKETKETRRGLQKIFATRERSIDFVGTLYNSLPNPDPVLDKKGETIDVYNDLMYDSRVTAAATVRKSAIKSMEWDLVGGDDIKESDIDFHREYFDKFKIEDIIGEILDAPLYGYKPIEIVWLPVEGGRYITPSDFVGKPPHWFTYDQENKLRMLTDSNMIYGDEVPPNKFIVARSEASYENPFGKGCLSACYWPVLFRRNGFKFLTLFVEKYGMPHIVGKAPAGVNPERMEEVLDLLDQLAQDGATVVPDDYQIELLESKEGKGKSDSIHKVFLDIMNTEIALAIIGNNLTIEVEGGSYAAANVHLEVRADIVEGDQRIVEGVFNELIKLVHAINFGEHSAAPVFKLFSEEKIDKARAERDKVLVNDVGIKFTPQYIEKNYNLSPDDYIIREEVESVD